MVGFGSPCSCHATRLNSRYYLVLLKIVEQHAVHKNRMRYQISILNMLQSSRRSGIELKHILSIVVVDMQCTTSEIPKVVQNAAAQTVL